MMVINKTIKEIENDIHILGRTDFNEDGSLHLSWSASGIALKFYGEAIAFGVLPYLNATAEGGDEDQRYVAVKLVIDGVATKTCISSEREKIFADGLSDEEHTAYLYKVSESDEPLRLYDVQIFGERAEILPYHPEYKLKIEYIGDSITCGYGVYGKRSGFDVFEEDVTAAYAYLTAERLGAEARIISWSGKGLVRSCMGLEVHRFIDFFKRRERCEQYGMHDFSSWIPDIVVVNGGTNDANSTCVEDYELEEKAEELYSFLRSVYPDARLIFFYGAMGQRYVPTYTDLIERLSKSDDNVFFFISEIIRDELGEVGSNGHPSTKGQRRISDELYAAIKQTEKQ